MLQLDYNVKYFPEIWRNLVIYDEGKQNTCGYFCRAVFRFTRRDKTTKCVYRRRRPLLRHSALARKFSEEGIFSSGRVCRPKGRLQEHKDQGSPWRPGHAATGGPLRPRHTSITPSAHPVCTCNENLCPNK